MQVDVRASQINTYISGIILEQLGFQIATQTFLSSFLKKITPEGGNAFRDAFDEGCKILIKLSNAIKETCSQQQWNFLYIVVIDYQDTRSKLPPSQIIKTMSVIHQLIKVKTFKIVIVGIDLPEQTEDQVNSIVRAAGLNALYIQSQESDIRLAFDQIYSLLRLEERQRSFYTENSQLLQSEQSKIQKYAILLNLAVNQSMRGSKWKQLCLIIEGLSSLLNKNDIIGGLVFNDSIKCIAKMSPSDQLFKAPKPSIRSSIYADKKQLGLKQSFEESIHQQKGCNACQII